MKKYKDCQYPFRVIFLPTYIAITMCLGIFIGQNMVSSIHFNDDITKEVSKFKQIISYIENDYVNEVNMPQLLEKTTKNLLKGLDPHTTYIEYKTAKLMRSQLQGNYEGIGIEFIIFDDTVYVFNVLKNGPSETIGLKLGDKIIKVDDMLISSFMGVTNENIIELLRGPFGTSVSIYVQRKGHDKLIKFDVSRDIIPQYSIDAHYMVDDEVGYIKIDRLTNITYQEFKESLRQLQEQGMKKMIIDLTDNPGGYLQIAVDLIDELLSDRQLIVYTHGKEKKYSEKYYSHIKGDFETGYLVIMIDENSASAAEVIAGALQDHDRALIVGRRSFGKGLVQYPFHLSDGSELRLTISKYYTPSGRCIQRPFDKGFSNYYAESHQRYLTKEMYVSDSIKYDSSLIFKTDKGRTVYGGGGITPDVFVPLDTTYKSEYLRNLIKTASIEEYILKYFQDFEEELEQLTYQEFKTFFSITDKMLDDLKQIGANNRLAFNVIEFDRSKKHIKLLIKAHLARLKWGDKFFYLTMNEQNEIFQIAYSSILKETQK